MKKTLILIAGIIAINFTSCVEKVKSNYNNTKTKTLEELKINEHIDISEKDGYCYYNTIIKVRKTPQGYIYEYYNKFNVLIQSVNVQQAIYIQQTK